MRDIGFGYNYACFRGETDEAAAFLADSLQFRGSIDQSDQAPQYIEALRKLRGTVTNIDTLSRSYSVGKAALLYDCNTDTGDGRIHTAESFQVVAGNIGRIRVVSDPNRLRSFAGNPA